MKKVALYARVSTDLQQKEGTIESQVSELKRQIVAAGNVLVKEYVDNGFSGAKLDRPALDQMRKDLKSDLFESIYFLNTDRIARDVTYQNIIITEILKHKKQIIINGKDYVHNPENKFELTVLGAVAELERAKIIERSLRGKQHRLKQGFMLGYGYNTYGYDYVKRSGDSPATMVINEKEAKVVRYIFETFVEGKVGLQQINRQLERQGVLTKTGSVFWNIDKIKRMLENTTYAGTKYFNTRHLSKEHSHPLRGLKYGKKVWRPKSEWIGVKVPAIVSQDLFDRVQARIEYNRVTYYHPKTKQLLCNLIRCGECDSKFYAYQRYVRDTRKTPILVRHKIAYACNSKATGKMHSSALTKRCKNPEIVSHLIETCVFGLIEKTLFDPDEMCRHMPFFTEAHRADQLKTERQLKSIDLAIAEVQTKKKHSIDEYASGQITHDEYIEKNIALDQEIDAITAKRTELLGKIPLLHKEDVVNLNLKRYCQEARAEYELCKDFDSKRQFLLDHIEKIIFVRDDVTVVGSVPIQMKAYDDPDQPSIASKIEFSIAGRIRRSDR